MKFTYDKVKNDVWEVIKDRIDFVYESSDDCDSCTDHKNWEYDEEYFDVEPASCTSHFDIDACRYFYANDDGSSNCNTPACVVGNWFVFEGFSPEDLGVERWEQIEGQDISSVLGKSKLDIEQHALAFLCKIQDYQDTQQPWGIAYESAVANIEGGE